MKLSSSTIIIMAVSIAVAILSFGLFHQYLPTKAAVGYYTTYKEQLETEAAKATKAKQRVEKAKTYVRQQTAKWSAIAETRTPPADLNQGGISLAVNPYQLVVDTEKFRNSIQRAVNVQVKKGGIRVLNQGPLVPAPEAQSRDAATVLNDYYNYASFNYPVLIFNFGAVSVAGTYEQIMANVRAYKTMPRYLAVTDGLSITGTSPNLVGTYNLSIVGFIRGKEIFPAATGSVAGAAPAGAAGAARAPGAAGFPGAPGGAPYPGGAGYPGAPGAPLGGRD